MFSGMAASPNELRSSSAAATAPAGLVSGVLKRWPPRRVQLASDQKETRMPEGQETSSTGTGGSGSAESESTVAGRVADATKAVREAASSASGMVGEAYEQGSG